MLEPDEDLAFGKRSEQLHWRHSTREGVTWRLAVEQDLPRLHELWDEMDRRMGGKQDRPDLFKHPVVLVLVAVVDTTGHIISAIYGECVVDWTQIGMSRRAARTLDSLFPWLALHLFGKVRVARVLVPMRLEKHMARLLPQMRNITQSVAQFVFRIPG